MKTRKENKRGRKGKAEESRVWNRSTRCEIKAETGSKEKRNRTKKFLEKKKMKERKENKKGRRGKKEKRGTRNVK